MLRSRALSGAISLHPVNRDALDELVAMRIACMEPSLTRVGRFDPVRARARLADDFDPRCTWHIEQAGARVGLVVVQQQADAWLLAHLYVHPRAQNRGIGQQVLLLVFAQVDAVGLPLTVFALKGSESNRFYQRHGFQWQSETEWDVCYQRPAVA